MPRMRLLILAVLATSVLIMHAGVFAAETVLFGFEQDVSGWQIPEWALQKEDNAGKDIKISTDYFDEGKSSLKIDADFPGTKWTGAYAETQQSFDWTAYNAVSVDVYLPPTAPSGLKAKMIFTVGENWTWTEMSRAFLLEPGKWTTITANLMPGSADFRVSIDDKFRRDIRKVGVRVESNKPVYAGPVYINNFRVNK